MIFTLNDKLPEWVNDRLELDQMSDYIYLGDITKWSEEQMLTVSNFVFTSLLPPDYDQKCLRQGHEKMSVFYTCSPETGWHLQFRDLRQPVAEAIALLFKTMTAGKLILLCVPIHTADSKVARRDLNTAWRTAIADHLNASSVETTTVDNYEF